MLMDGNFIPEPDPAVPEYFFLLSYSSRLSVVYRLEQIGSTVGVYALLFHGALGQVFQSSSGAGVGEILLIDSMLTRPPSFLSLRSIAGARRRLAELQERYFEQIPDGSLVHFYNRHYSTLAANVLAQLHKRCNVAYTECDPVGLPKTAYGPKAAAYWLVHTAIYRAQFEWWADSVRFRAKSPTDVKSSRILATGSRIRTRYGWEMSTKNSGSTALLGSFGS